jgi:predicted dehydrogenase/threonine dehydrogenase-like Zn-dependent dehydrogenase
MKQVFIRKGKVVVEEVPSPVVSEDEILVEIYCSCISAGTEVANIRASGRPLIKKVMEKPQDAGRVIKSIREDGLISTVGKVVNRIEARHSTGYSASGIVIEAGSNIKDFKKGDRVACAGIGIANHAEFIVAPENLTVKVPKTLSFKEASTVALGSIALQGVRRCSPKIGESVVVIGLGIIGQLSVQLLKSSGCYVIGTDIDKKRIARAARTGLDKGFDAKNTNIVEEVIRSTNGYGADSVIITASSRDSIVINQAIEMSRKKGKVVIVGNVNMAIDRENFYEKELDLLISTSYGPGRYDERYEKKGFDYPYSYIRWTENRNMQEYLNLLSEGKIDAGILIDGTYNIENAPAAYESLNRPGSRPLIIILEYKKDKKPKSKIIIKDYRPGHGKINVGIIGAGGFIRGVHLPNLKKMDNIFKINAICSRTGSNADSLARQYKAKYSATGYRLLLDDKDIDLIIIGTRHNLHSKIALEAVNAGKAVFMEKPMALSSKELLNLVKALEKKKTPFIVGFNRRFSPLVEKIKSYTDSRINPMIINYRVNAGYIPRESWVHNEEGGGRNIGEACHFYDLFNFFTNSIVKSINAVSIDPVTKQYGYDDNFVATIKYEDGSVCNLVYTALGTDNAPKELMEIYFDNKVIVLDDYKKLNFFGVRGKNIDGRVQNKGHFEELLKFGNSLKDKDAGQLIPLWQMVQATEISFEVERKLKK